MEEEVRQAFTHGEWSRIQSVACRDCLAPLQWQNPWILGHCGIVDSDGSLAALAPWRAGITMVSLLEISQKTKCALTQKKATSLIQLSTSASPTGTYQDFVRRVEEEKTAAETGKTTCIRTAETAYTTGVSELEPANEARKAAHEATYQALVTAKDTENTNFKAAENLKIGNAATALAGLLTAKTEANTDKETKNLAFTTAENNGISKMNAAVTRKTDNDAAATALKASNIEERHATLTSTRNNALNAISPLETTDAEFCTTQQLNLDAEETILNSLKALLTEGGNDGTGLRVVRDDTTQTGAEAAALAVKDADALGR